MKRKSAFTLLALGLLLARPASAGPGHHEPVSDMPEAERTFDEVMKLVEASYMDKGLSKSELWTAALQGMLQRLDTNHDKPVNLLLSPDDLKELEQGISGSVSGIGVVIRYLENVVVVKEVVPGGPAEKAGIRGGDRILAVDGKPVKDRAFRDVVFQIRGPTGTTVDLLVQREADEWVKPVTRGVVRVESVVADLETLPGDVAYVRILNFSKDTLQSFDEVASAMRRRGVKGLVLDMRGTPGGLLDAALGVAGRFLGKGDTIVTLRGRDGKDDARKSAFKGPKLDVPTVILVDRDTASGAEILAAALSQQLGAPLVGEKTFGKGTVEEIRRLKNGFAVKMSIARFVGPNGKSWANEGLAPDFPIPRPDDAAERAYSTRARIDLEADPILRAGLSVLTLRAKR